MSIRIFSITFAVAMIAIIATTSPSFAWPSEVVAAPSLGRTEVIIFTPTVPNAPQRQGYCWTESIAVTRVGAWRCMIGNIIADPCFSSAEFSDAVVCGANPATSDAGFLLRLTQPLPPTSGVALPPPSPWMVELAIGQNQVPGPYAMPPPKTYCSVLTGTSAVVNGQAVPFLCWENNIDSKPKLGDTQIGLLGDFSPGKIWTVTEVYFVKNPVPGAKQPFRLTEKKTIALERIWE
jgi:hypothetical protein